MMEVAFSSAFKRAFKKRIKNTEHENRFWELVHLFVENPSNPTLKTHKLSGKLQGYWSFSIDFDKRVIFYYTTAKPVKAIFIDIGSHEEVY